MTIDLVPLKEFSERYAKGWRMVPGYPLEPGDNAVMLQSPGHGKRARTNNVLIAQQLAVEAFQKTRGFDHEFVNRKLDGTVVEVWP